MYVCIRESYIAFFNVLRSKGPTNIKVRILHLGHCELKGSVKEILEKFEQS